MKKVLIYFTCFSLLLGDVRLLAASGSRSLPTTESFSGGNTGYEPWYHYIGDIVNAANGNLYLSFRDISIKARGFGMETVRRAYNSLNASNDGPFGYGWTFNYNTYLIEEGGNVDLFEGDGSKHVFASTGGGNYSSPPGVHSKLTKYAGGFSLKSNDGTSYQFDLNGKLLNMLDKNGNKLITIY